MINLHETDRLVELLPCPFCGGEAELRETTEDDNSRAPRPHRHYLAECGSCGAVIGVESRRWWSSAATPPENDEDRVARAAAVAAWNRRALTAMGGKAEPVTVKPLEWTGPSGRHQYKGFDGVVYGASNAALRLDYSIDHYLNREGRPSFLLRNTGQWFETLEAAKTACQEKHDAAVQTALTPASPVQARTGEVTITDKQFDEIISENIIGGSDDFPVVNRAALLADLSATMDAVRHGNALSSNESNKQ